MLKSLLFASTALFLLCGPALADPTPPATSFNLGLVVASGNQTRHYALAIVDDSCGSISAKDAGKSEDSVQVCARHGAFELEWILRDGRHEVRTKSSVVAKRGASFALDGDGAKLTVTVQ